MSLYETTQYMQFNNLLDANNEARNMLRQKQEEIEKYNATISEAENMLSLLKEQVNEKQIELDTIKNDSDVNKESSQQKYQQKILQLKENQAKEIEEIIQSHEEEINALRADFEQTLRESEQWNEKHSSIAFQKKLDELHQLHEQEHETKVQLNHLSLTKSPISNQMNHQQARNLETIAELEIQISELSAIVREEIRVARTKVDECILTVDLRKQEHETEIQKLQNELKQRSETYRNHVSALTQQYRYEEESMENDIRSHLNRMTNTENIIAQVGKYHEVQTKTVFGDIDIARKTILTPKNDLRNSYDSIKSLVRESAHLNNEIFKIKSEERLIDTEIAELSKENQSLLKQIKSLKREMDRRE